jgi:hypothetical protein
MWDFVIDKSGAGAGFLRELRFPLPIYIPSPSPQSSSLSPEAGIIDQEWPQCQASQKQVVGERSACGTTRLRVSGWPAEWSCPEDKKQFPIFFWGGGGRIVGLLDNSGEQTLTLTCGAKKQINNTIIPPLNIRNSIYENPGIYPASWKFRKTFKSTVCFWVYIHSLIHQRL